MRYRAGACIALSVALAGLVEANRHTSVPRRGQHEGPTPPALPTAALPLEAPPEPPRRGAPEVQPPARRSAPPPAVPPSLRGTEVDGALPVGESGDLIPGPEVLRLFDYFLTATGEEPDESIKARIVAAIEQRTSGAAREQALELLDGYLDYREAARAIVAGAEQDPESGLAALRALRRERFGEPVASQLFGDEELEQEVALTESAVAGDPTRSSAELEERVEELEAALPAELREARAATLAPLRQRAEEQAMRDAGASDEEIHAYRVATVGAAAAARLAELDRQRAVWRQRVEAFRVEIERLSATVSDPERLRAAQEALLEHDFAPPERLRVRALLLLQR